ncbi:Storkhead-box protein 1 [Nibea albiflora]|uniref:Storkhead-box protein 1 n=1 Tax=Nibea albiflora TaxID=240163 RepID=A0ACB7EPN1_NIBAL|nr:Storkhead-box protein 1 [Nibea albiflora]
MESFLQIAPHSLAIVLSRVAAGEAVGVSESDELPRHHTGYEIFADFKAENTQQHVWNQRITEAVSETFFLGWIDEHVLLIQGKEDHLEVLREGWMRRSLNPPRGFTIKYLGDVSPISMSPISQSQFIPLGEVLLLAISAMNSAHKPVTQDALTEHLQTCFPAGSGLRQNKVLRTLRRFFKSIYLQGFQCRHFQRRTGIGAPTLGAKC